MPPEQKGRAFLKFLNEDNVLKHLEQLPRRDQFNRTNQNKWPINCVYIFIRYLKVAKLCSNTNVKNKNVSDG